MLQDCDSRRLRTGQAFTGPLLLMLLTGALAAAGCVKTDTSICPESGKICPTTYYCTADGMDCIFGLCGNGVLDEGEVCDDGNIRDGDSCAGDCLEITSCGNGILEPEYNEMCDDGNNVDRDGCSADCSSDESCGNGVHDLLVSEGCDDGNLIDGDGCSSMCVLETCGDGILDIDNGEICDDGNLEPGDYCGPNCRVEPMVTVGAEHTCALLDTGRVRCWGAAYVGQLGYGDDTNNVGDNELPAEAGDIDLGGTVFQIDAGNLHTCALMDTGTVRCWGEGTRGRLGYGNQDAVGDNEFPSVAGDVPLPGLARAVTAGSLHSCALLVNGDITCWGEGDYGRLGYGNTQDIGDDETPENLTVDVGGPAIKVVAGTHHTCAILETGAVRCWGLGNVGRLGYATGGPPVGDNELPSSAGDVQIVDAVNDPPDTHVIDIGLGVNHTCAVLNTGTVRCWGAAVLGPLGYGNSVNIGDDELPFTAGDVDIDGLQREVVQITSGGSSNCVLLKAGELGRPDVRCWGWNDRGQLGLGLPDELDEDIGDNETPAALDNPNLNIVHRFVSVVPDGQDASVIQVAFGQQHVCALIDTHDIRCWGLTGQARLGYLVLEGNIGDDEGEYPSNFPVVPYLDHHIPAAF